MTRIIYTNESSDYFIVCDSDNKVIGNISKKSNTIENVKKVYGECAIFKERVES